MYQIPSGEVIDSGFHWRFVASRWSFLLARAFRTPAVSNIGMRRIILTFWFLLLTGCLWAQKPRANEPEQEAIQRAKSTLVSSLDSSLPKVSLEFFLNYESGGADLRWQVNDCGEQTGNPPTDRGNDSPMCVEAHFAKNQADVTVLVSVGTFQKGPSGAPALFKVTVRSPSGKIHSLRRLGELPKELHRPAHGMPRDLPVPVTASSEFPCAAPGECLRRE